MTQKKVYVHKDGKNRYWTKENLDEMIETFDQLKVIIERIMYY